jgi:uncharacterized protein YdcH (DUF465 family)
MTIEHHELAHEFPEHKEAIHELKMNNAHFKKLFSEYHELDRHVYRIEVQNEVVCDDNLEDLKKQRIQLKDSLYKMLESFEPA